MQERIEVVGAEQAQTHHVHDAGHRPPWTSRLVTAFFGAAVGAASVFLLASPSAQPESSTPSVDQTLPAPAAVAATPPASPAEPTLTELVPGLDVDLVSYGYTTGGTSIVQRWESDTTEPTTIEVPFGVATSDISNQWIATLVDQRYGPSTNLHVGNAVYQEVVATDVVGAVWSSDEMGRLAWVEQTAGDTIIRDASFMGAVGGKHLVVPSRPIIQSFRVAVSDDAQPVWLDGERLTIASGGSLTSLQADGTTVAELESASLVTATDGLAVARIDDAMTMIDNDLQTRGLLPVDHESCREARFAPPSSDTFRLAVLCEGSDGTPTVEVIDIIDVGQEVLGFTTRLSVDIGDTLGPITWVDGDRFLASPQPDARSRPLSTILVIDVQTGRITELPWRGVVLGVLGAR